MRNRAPPHPISPIQAVREVASSNQTLNAFLGNRRKAWMTSSTSSSPAVSVAPVGETRRGCNGSNGVAEGGPGGIFDGAPPLKKPRGRPKGWRKTQSEVESIAPTMVAAGSGQSQVPMPVQMGNPVQVTGSSQGGTEVRLPVVEKYFQDAIPTMAMNSMQTMVQMVTPVQATIVQQATPVYLRREMTNPLETQNKRLDEHQRQFPNQVVQGEVQTHDTPTAMDSQNQNQIATLQPTSVITQRNQPEYIDIIANLPPPTAPLSIETSSRSGISVLSTQQAAANNYNTMMSLDALSNPAVEIPQTSQPVVETSQPLAEQVEQPGQVGPSRAGTMSTHQIISSPTVSAPQPLVQQVEPSRQSTIPSLQSVSNPAIATPQHPVQQVAPNRPETMVSHHPLSSYALVADQLFTRQATLNGPETMTSNRSLSNPTNAAPQHLVQQVTPNRPDIMMSNQSLMTPALAAPQPLVQQTASETMPSNQSLSVPVTSTLQPLAEQVAPGRPSTTPTIQPFLTHAYPSQYSSGNRSNSMPFPQTSSSSVIPTTRPQLAAANRSNSMPFPQTVLSPRIAAPQPQPAAPNNLNNIMSSQKLPGSETSRPQSRRGSAQTPPTMPPSLENVPSHSSISNLRSSLRFSVQVIDDYIQKFGGVSTLVPLERLRFAFLRDACQSEDVFYLALHQLYCLWSINAEAINQNGMTDVVALSAGFEIISSLIQENDKMALVHVKWFAQFPSPIKPPSQTTDLYRSAISNVEAFVLKLSTQYRPFVVTCVQRGYPPLVDELVTQFSLISPVLQGVIFTIITRRHLGIPNDAYGEKMEKVFVEDRDGYLELSARFNSADAPSRDDIWNRNIKFANRYLKLRVDHQGTINTNYTAQQPVPSHQDSLGPQASDLSAAAQTGQNEGVPLLGENQRQSNSQVPTNSHHQNPVRSNASLPQIYPNGHLPILNQRSASGRRVPSCDPTGVPFVQQNNSIPAGIRHSPNQMQGQQSTMQQRIFSPQLQQQHPYARASASTASGLPGPTFASLQASQAQAVQELRAVQYGTLVQRTSRQQNPLPQPQMTPQQQMTMIQPQMASQPTRSSSMSGHPSFQTPQYNIQNSSMHAPSPQSPRSGVVQLQHPALRSNYHPSPLNGIALPAAPQVQPQNLQHQQGTAQPFSGQLQGQQRTHQAQQPQQRIRASQPTAQQPTDSWSHQNSNHGFPSPSTVYSNPTSMPASPHTSTSNLPNVISQRAASHGYPNISAQGGPLTSAEEAAAAHYASQDPSQRALFPPYSWVPPVTLPNPTMTALHQAHVRSPHLIPADAPPNTMQSDPAGRYYQAIKGFAIQPTLLNPELGPVSKFQFNVLTATFQRIAAERNYSSSGPQKRDVVRGTLQFRIRCIKLSRDVNKLSEAVWIVSETTWPPSVFLEINKFALEVRRKNHHGKDLPVDVTSYIISRGPESTSHVRISVPRVGKTQRDNRYIFAVEIVEVLRHDGIMYMVLEKQRLHASQTLSQIQASLSASPGSDDDDFAIVATGLTIDLTDPFTAQMFVIPVRGNTCPHRECFDLETFLMTRESRPKRPAQPCMVDVWKCPLCGRDARPYSLRLDEFLLGVRQKLLSEPGGKDTKAILISPDGSWKPKPESQPTVGSRKRSASVAGFQGSRDADKKEGAGEDESEDLEKNSGMERRRSGEIEIVELDDD